MIKSIGKLAVAGILAATPFSAHALAPTHVINFEAVGDLNAVDSVYGPLAVFSDNATGLVDDDLGGSSFGQSGNPAPDPGTIMVAFDNTPIIMNVAGGFEASSFSVWYANPNQETSIGIYSGANGTGYLLALVDVPANQTGPDYWQPFELGTASGLGGLAHSAVFYNVADWGDDGPNWLVAFDNVSFSDYVAPPDQSPVPEPSTVVGGILFAGIAATRVLRRKK